MASIEPVALATRTASGASDIIDTSNVARVSLSLIADSGDTYANRGKATLPARFAVFAETREANGTWRRVAALNDRANLSTSGPGSLYGYANGEHGIGNYRATFVPDDELRVSWTIERGHVPSHVSDADLFASVAFSVAGTTVEGA